MHHTEKLPQKSPNLQLLVVITNGDPSHDTRLRFEFSQAEKEAARLWLVRLPALRNYDSFPRPLHSGAWELRLEAQTHTQPLEILNYTKQSAQEWLRKVHLQPAPGMTELLILADHRQFTIAITEG
jgi:hypothetical protein